MLSTTFRPLVAACIFTLTFSTGLHAAQAAEESQSAGKAIIRKPSLPALDEITIVGDAGDVATSAGSATVIDKLRLEQFRYTDIQRVVRDIPGVSVQVEDGYGLRPNLSIRGTATERSARITLLEDNVLIAPAPYSAPAAYYFPTTGRMHQVEVLKGSSSIKQGPYTVGGSMNLISTPIPDSRAAFLDLEAAQHSTSRFHGAYGDSFDNFGYLVEGHVWDSAGFQTVDLSDTDTGLHKDDWMLKLRFNSDADANVYQQLDFKFQYATENSDQSYLGLTDGDFDADPYRRYASSRFDNIDTDHDQVIVRYLARFDDSFSISATAYSNNHSRNWFKTEGLDGDGSSSAETFQSTSWFNVVQAVNGVEDASGLTASQLQSILDGGDSAIGSIQLRGNNRSYYSRGIQLAAEWGADIGGIEHDFEFGVRLHEDQEDRLQRNSNYHQENGALLLDDPGLLGNAGNTVQDARATSFFVYDEIGLGSLTLTPGVRYEDISQSRTRWETRNGQTNDPSSRELSNFRDSQTNDVGVWIPGMGALYSLNESVAVYGGVHKGFTAPSNTPGVNEETSVNYELGFRFSGDRTHVDSAIFFTDYDNIVGVCTSSSGSNCDIGEAFNGDAASVVGLEVVANREFQLGGDFAVPVLLSYTWMDATFDSDIADTEYFGDVSKGDPLPYIPEHQFLVSAGLTKGRFGSYLNANYVGTTCVRASCGEFEKTDSLLIVDLSLNFQLNDHIAFYSRVDNLTDEAAIVARHPYGARPNMGRTSGIGMRISL